MFRQLCGWLFLGGEKTTCSLNMPLHVKHKSLCPRVDLQRFDLLLFMLMAAVRCGSVTLAVLHVKSRYNSLKKNWLIIRRSTNVIQCPVKLRTLPIMFYGNSWLLLHKFIIQSVNSAMFQYLIFVAYHMASSTSRQNVAISPI